MSDLDDMEASMGKALKQVRRRQLTVDGLITLASFAGGMLGFGWGAKTYLGSIEHKVDQIATLSLAQAEQIKSLTDSNTRAHERVTVAEREIAVNYAKFEDLKAEVKDIVARSGVLVRGRP